MELGRGSWGEDELGLQVHRLEPGYPHTSHLFGLSCRDLESCLYAGGLKGGKEASL